MLWLAPRGAPHHASPGHALAPDTDEEKAKNAQRVKDVCSIVLTKEANGPDVNCDLAHRWRAKEIRALAGSKDLSWSLGRLGAVSRSARNAPPSNRSLARSEKKKKRSPQT